MSELINMLNYFLSISNLHLSGPLVAKINLVLLIGFFSVAQHVEVGFTHLVTLCIKYFIKELSTCQVKIKKLMESVALSYSSAFSMSSVNACPTLNIYFALNVNTWDQLNWSLVHSLPLIIRVISVIRTRSKALVISTKQRRPVC